MNSAVGSIFNEKIVEKKGLWVPLTVHRTHWYDLKFEKQAYKKKKKGEKTQTHKPQAPFGYSLFLLKLKTETENTVVK